MRGGGGGGGVEKYPPTPNTQNLTTKNTPPKPDNNLCIYFTTFILFFLSGEDLVHWFKNVRDTIGKNAKTVLKSGSPEAAAAPKPLPARPAFLIRHAAWLEKSIGRIGYRQGTNVSLNFFFFLC